MSNSGCRIIFGHDLGRRLFSFLFFLLMLFLARLGVTGVLGSNDWDVVNIMIPCFGVASIKSTIVFEWSQRERHLIADKQLYSK